MKLIKKKSILFGTFLFSSLSLFAQEVNKTNENGKREGKWVGYYETSNRVRYDGVFKDGTEQGVFNFYEDSPKSNIVAKRDFSKGDGSAYTTFFDSKGKKISEGNFVDKLKEGNWKYYHANGTTLMSEEFYIADKLNGNRKVFYKSGELSEISNYKNGLLEGELKQYAENGQVIKEEFYVNDLKHGKAIYRDAEGNITSEIEFVNGSPIKPKP